MLGLAAEPYDVTKDSSLVKVSCIVPAYNEGSRIEAVLRVLTTHPLIDEIIVVDDCSTDDTVKISTAFDAVKVMRSSRNAGKTHALSVGFAAASGQIYLLIDADLTGLDASALTALLRPVLDDRADMTISLRRNAPNLWHMIGIDYISGERVFRRDLVARQVCDLDDLPPFGFEVWLNSVAIAAATRISIVPWHHVESPAKSVKRGLARGLFADLRMVVDMVRTVTPSRLIHQIVALRRLMT